MAVTERELKPASTPGVRFAASLIIAVFWNGITGVVFFHAFASAWQGRAFEWGALLVGLPFVAIGLFILAWAGHNLLALKNPRPRLVLRPGTLALGEHAQVGWTLSGSTERLEELTLSLIGRESATYRRGTDTETDTAIFHRARLAAPNEPLAMRSGEAQLAIPPDSMHSFKSSNNAFTWLLLVEGRQRGWPDISEEFELEVKPHLRSREEAP